ncbi:hypothetical protein BV22DRAFT_1194989 [Leucogyrophana mollusca]|uniref:Uncharacterized protein n=1 Tax=Leucogyrophana mollusca TaxID=85980 RepID=A0ACB8BK59_9AGAM|nr:hypothetical protein BV22DRAFT_1194989 [Leucogyrophana mollusca]
MRAATQAGPLTFTLARTVPEPTVPTAVPLSITTILALRRTVSPALVPTSLQRRTRCITPIIWRSARTRVGTMAVYAPNPRDLALMSPSSEICNARSTPQDHFMGEESQVFHCV